MPLKIQIRDDLKEAMKARDSVRLDALRMLISEIKKREIDKKAELDDTEVQKVISSMQKQRNDSVEAFTKGGREDLATKERQEIEILKAYLPAQMTHAEVEALVAAVITETGAAGPQDIGKVMKAAVAKAAGQADGKIVNEIARAKLSGK